MAPTDTGTHTGDSASAATTPSALAHLAFVDALRSDGHACTIDHAAARKSRFDARVKAVVFETGDLVQIYQDCLESTMSTERKLAEKWSGPMEVVGRYLKESPAHWGNGRRPLRIG